jgi:hypothetical protein
MRTGGAIGQAVGYAAALCCRHNCTPRQVYNDHLGELLDGLLEADATILVTPLNVENDIAQSATVTATSETGFNDQEPGPLVPLTAPAGVILWDWAPSTRIVEPFLHNDTDQEQPLTLSIYRAQCEPKWMSMEDYKARGRNDLRDTAFTRILTVPVAVPPRHHGWLQTELPAGLDLGERDCALDDDRLLIALSENEHVQWALAERGVEIAEMVEHSHHSPGWRALGVMAAVRLTPSPCVGEARNAVNGFHRRFSRGPTNMWISAAGQSLPQDLVLGWDEPQTFDKVELTFDNLTRLGHEQPWGCGIRVVDSLCKSYELAYLARDRWHGLASAEDNHHRFCRHRFAPVTTTKLRLRVLATHGGEGSARVYQVRVCRTAGDC